MHLFIKDEAAALLKGVLFLFMDKFGGRVSNGFRIECIFYEYT